MTASMSRTVVHPLTEHVMQLAILLNRRDEKSFVGCVEKLHSVCEHHKEHPHAAHILEVIPTREELLHMDWKLREAVVNYLQELRLPENS